MNLQKFLQNKRQLWHKHFIPSIFAGLVVALISLIYEATLSNVVLLASVGSSAVILTNSHSHHLTKLHTTIVSYLFTIIISSLVYLLNTALPLHVSINIFLLISIVGTTLFLANSFHPPAIAASLSFILLEKPLIDLLYLFAAIILVLICIRFLTYVFSQRLSVKEFTKEFKKSF